MQTSIKLSSSLYLNLSSVLLQNEAKAVQPPTNYYVLSDRSGSMYSVMKQLRDDLDNKIRNVIKQGDTITLAGFSGEGDFKYFTIGFRKALDADFDTLKAMIDKNLVATGLTCFSEVLEAAPEMIKQVSSQYPGDNVLCMLTDGEPVTSNNRLEEEKTLKALSEVSPLVSASVFVGYGNYYNRDLMAKMAEVTGGSLIHADEFSDFVVHTNNLFQNISENYVLVTVPKTDTVRNLAFSISSNGIMNHKIENNEIKLYADKRESTCNYAYFSKNAEFDVIGKNDLLKNDDMLPYLYAAVFSLFKRGMKLEALELLVYIGDVYLIDKLNNSLTNFEYSVFEKEIVKAVSLSEARFVEGRKADYLPSLNKFCLLELVELLKNDSTVKFYPFKVEYNKTTQTYEQTDKRLKFNANEEEGFEIKALTWNEEEVNLSIRMMITGTVKLSDIGDEYKKHNLPETYNTYRFRNYSIISDGNINMKKLPLSMSSATFETLKKLNVVPKKDEYAEGTVYHLDITNIPVINKAIASGEYNAVEIANKQVSIEYRKARLKVLKSYVPNKTAQYSGKATTVLGTEAAAYLDSVGLGKNGFDPKTVAVEPTDVRIARTFQVKVAGFSSLPKIEEVIEKMKSGKSMTVSYDAMARVIEFVESIKKTMSEKAFIEEINTLIEQDEKMLNQERTQVQVAVFSVLLGKTWFTNIDGNEVEVNGIKVKFDFGEKKIKI